MKINSKVNNYTVKVQHHKRKIITDRNGFVVFTGNTSHHMIDRITPESLIEHYHIPKGVTVEGI